MKIDANLGAGAGGLLGIVLSGAAAAVKYDLSKVDQMQQAVGYILGGFIICALVGWVIAKSLQPKK